MEGEKGYTRYLKIELTLETNQIHPHQTLGVLVHFSIAVTEDLRLVIYKENKFIWLTVLEAGKSKGKGELLVKTLCFHNMLGRWKVCFSSRCFRRRQNKGSPLYKNLVETNLVL